VPEGDSVHRAAQRLRILEGELVKAESPHPIAAVLRVAERIDGKRLERVEARGKNILLTFEGGVVLRSHLRMHGRWQVQPAARPVLGKPWLILHARDWKAVQRNGRVLEIGTRRLAGLGPDIMVVPPAVDAMVHRFRRAGQSRELGEALLDQSLVAGIGNKWKAEALFEASLSPWAKLGDLSDAALTDVLAAASKLMRAARRGNRVYRKVGRPCPRCGTPIKSQPQGEHARMAYWCPVCQGGTEAAGS
jgi:endonuclease VIII